jgi:hypothetical protein
MAARPFTPCDTGTFSVFVGFTVGDAIDLVVAFSVADVHVVGEASPLPLTQLDLDLQASPTLSTLPFTGRLFSASSCS